MSVLAGKTPAFPSETEHCCVCGVELSTGAGRFYYDVYSICLDCHDAGHRTPPLKKDAPPAA